MVIYIQTYTHVDWFLVGKVGDAWRGTHWYRDIGGGVLG